MKNLLMNCYFDGMTISEAIIFIERCYHEAPTQKQINNAMKTIKEQLNKTWK